MDVVIPIVFPDYLISVTSPRIEVDLFPWTDFDNFTIPETNHHVPELGHAGVLFINGKNGTTKYYEYGRYDHLNLGIVRRVPIKNVSVMDNKVDLASLKIPLRQISRIAGQGGHIQGVYIEVENKYTAMLNYVEGRKAMNSKPKRRAYDLLSNSCIHFVKRVTEIAGVATPWILDPRPSSYIGEFRDDFPDIDYNNQADILTIEGTGKF